MDKEEAKELIEIATEAREKSYSPYSKFPIGAALLTSEGKVFTGTNIENAAYGLTLCAERTAIFKAVSEGYRKFKAIAVVADTERPVPPCGSCRQVIQEFGDNIMVIMSNLNDAYQVYTIDQLLPAAFNRKDMD
ncbi:MAG: cytidine deaminase [Halanaerobiales bacterium]